MKENIDIESIFKKNLESFEANPGINAWSAIQSQIGNNAAGFAGKSLLKIKAAKIALLTGATLVSGIGIGYLAFNDNITKVNNSKTEIHTISQSANNPNQILIENKNLSVTEINSVNKPDKVVSILEVKQKSGETQKVLVEIRQNNGTQNGSIISSWLSSSAKPNSALIDKLLQEIESEENAVSTTNTDYLVVQKIDDNEVIAAIKPSDWTGVAPLTVEFSNLTSAKSYKWNFGDNTESIEAQPKHTFNEQGNYVVELSVTDNNGKSKTNRILIEVTNPLVINEASSITKYNVFTPNGDGENDEFKLNGSNISQFEIYIYDTRGNQVFSSNNINEAWNGYDKKGSVCPDGQYHCVFKALGNDGVEHKDKILITLNRTRK